MIVRIWHGWTVPGKADLYESLLTNEIIPGIIGRNIPGFKKIQVLKRLHEDETEFSTMMWFDNLKSVKQFTGENYENAYVPDQARKLLSRFDQKTAHYELISEMQTDFSKFI